MRTARLKTIMLLFTLIASITIFSATNLLLHSAFAQSPTIYLDPSTYEFPETTPKGTKFNVTVSCVNVPDVGGAQIYMEFNDTIINATRWFAPTWDPNFFMPTTPAPALLPNPPDPGYQHISAGKGRILIAVSKGGLPPTAPWGHDGKIAIIEFNITKTPPPELTTLLNINKTDTYLLDPLGSEISGVIKQNGTYHVIPEFSTIMMIIALVTSIAFVALVKKKIPL